MDLDLFFFLCWGGAAACAPYALYTASSGSLGTVPGPYAATQTCAFSIRSDISALAAANPGATIYTTVAYTSFNLGCMYVEQRRRRRRGAATRA